MREHNPKHKRSRSTSSVRPTLSSTVLLYSLSLLFGASLATASSLSPGWMMRVHHVRGMVRRDGTNFQQFKGTLGAPPPAVTSTGNSQRPYGVDENSFTDFQSAGERSCNIQFTSCQQVATAKTNGSAPFSVADCQNQHNACIATTNDVEIPNLNSSSLPATTTTSTTSTTTSTTSTITISSTTSGAAALANTSITTSTSTSSAFSTSSSTSDILPTTSSLAAEAAPSSSLSSTSSQSEPFPILIAPITTTTTTSSTTTSSQADSPPPSEAGSTESTSATGSAVDARFTMVDPYNEQYMWICDP